MLLPTAGKHPPELPLWDEPSLPQPITEPTTVGRSHRTPAKRAVMNRLLGKEVGVVTKLLERGAMRCVWFDLNAGDAAPDPDKAWTHGSSPGLMTYHARNAGVPFSITLCEIEPATYGRLIDNLARELPHLGYTRTSDHTWRWWSDLRTVTALNIDSRTVDIGHVQRGDAVFVLNDPNWIGAWAMRDTFPQEIAERISTPSKRHGLFRSLSTLGVNVGGGLRTERETRDAWFDLVRSVELATPESRDLYLARIVGDPSKWGYLIAEATEWRDQTVAEVDRAFRDVGLQMESAWMRLDRPMFDAIQRDLFLTNKERRDETRGLW